MCLDAERPENVSRVKRLAQVSLKCSSNTTTGSNSEEGLVTSEATYYYRLAFYSVLLVLRGPSRAGIEELGTTSRKSDSEPQPES